MPFFFYPDFKNPLDERLLKNLLPLNKTIKITDEEGTKPLQLDTLLDNFKKYYVDFGGDFEEFKKLKEYKDILLNPLSHDNLDAPIYKLELLELKRALIKLRSLESKILVSIKDDPDKFIVLTETDSVGETYRYKIILKEYLTAFKLLDGSWKLSNPECKFEKRKRVSDNVTEVLDRNMKLNRGFENIKHALNVVGNNSELFDIITSEGLVLRTYL